MQRSGEVDECAVSAVAIQVGDETTLDDLFGHASRHPDAVGFSIRGDDGWLPVTYREFATKVGELANGLIASGVAPGDRVALMSRNRFEWALCDYAIWAAGAVTVPIYETSSVAQVEWILGDCSPGVSRSALAWSSRRRPSAGGS